MDFHRQEAIMTRKICDQCGVTNAPSHKGGVLHRYYAAIMAGIAEGKSASQLARELGVSYQRMCRIVAQLCHREDLRELDTVEDDQ
jgi:hypothetical protein